MKPEASLARKSADPTISLGSAIRFMTLEFRICSTKPGICYG